MKGIQKLFLPVLMLFIPAPASAQVNWPSPEVGQMYHNAQAYAEMGNYKDAITIYKQAILLAPGVMILYRDLGDALYLSGNYYEAEQVLTPLLEKPGADTQCYLLLASCQEALYDTKHATATLKKGLELFPASGSLYHEMGNVHYVEKDKKAALNAWLDGILKDPAYTKNYYDAANVYLRSDRVLWGILYGEMYLDMERDTTRADEMKSKLFAAYKTLFDNMVNDEVPHYGKAGKQAPAGTFEEAVMQVYRSLTPVVSDGITTENLIMVRARFLMDWFAAYGNKYPFPLFSYQDKVTRSGHFDMYNEWLFGNAESITEYNAWNTFHDGDMKRFLEWQIANPLMFSSGGFYNDRNMDGLFSKKKK